MKIIDDRGKLFGLINIIDLFVLLLIAILVAAVGSKLSGRALVQDAGMVPVHLEFYISDVRQEMVDAVEVGDTAYDSATGQAIGTVIEKRAVPYETPVETADGRVVRAEVPGRHCLYLTLEGKAQVAGDTVRVGATEMRAGLQVTLETRHLTAISYLLKTEFVESVEE